jgi:hypothetical protein
MSLSRGIQRSAAALVPAALIVWLLSGCAIATRPSDGVDSPHYARPTPSEMRDQPSGVSVVANDIRAE